MGVGSEVWESDLLDPPGLNTPLPHPLHQPGDLDSVTRFLTQSKGM